MFGWFKNFATPSQLKAAGVLGMNARNYDIIAKSNKRRLYPLVDDKVQTKKLANEVGINTPRLIGIVEVQNEVDKFLDLVKDYKEFVIKPAHGSGGKGVLVIKQYDAKNFVTASEKVLTYNEVYQHISNILSGLYSLGGKYDIALIEEMVHFSNQFQDFSYQGIPDVRVIVYQGFPALAMMRLATKESGGRANLHQGAVGVGIDVRTGQAISAVSHNLPIAIHPDTKADLMELKVPFWREHLEIAVKGYEMTGLGYLGADIVLDKFRGPMMLELNARPGLAIQIANNRGLRNILEDIKNNYPKGLNPQQRLDYVLGVAKD
ncbi:MAG: alpha-L-glutamate ligase-like protein [Alphaproteobacteria bacterium]|jgi:alpha-L-glutamate ligase-like protein|nr:alpha-L-glutamate ligase-like protein [Alphaproteobacteria bacterium]